MDQIRAGPFAGRIEETHPPVQITRQNSCTLRSKYKSRFSSISALVFDSESTSMQIAGAIGLDSASAGICFQNSPEPQTMSGTFTPFGVSIASSTAPSPTRSIFAYIGVTSAGEARAEAGNEQTWPTRDHVRLYIAILRKMTPEDRL